MSILTEDIFIYSGVFLLGISIVILYLVIQRRTSKKTLSKINRAKEEGLYEPLSLHPVVDPNSCIKTGACISACPEKDILGIYNGKATVINASQCIGHGACFHACPTEAISLCIGTEKRGVDLPHVAPTFESNVPGIFIAGELGGMGLIRNAVEQGRQAVENIVQTLDKKHKAGYDLLIVGMGPAGVSASLAAKKYKLNAITLEQNSLGGTVFTFPRTKLVMTAPMELPLYGKVKLFETNKQELLGIWEKVVTKYDIPFRENAKVESITRQSDYFEVRTAGNDTYTAHKILLAIGRRGSPRKLEIPGEDTEMVSYRLLEPEQISGQRIVVVGGGDSAIEAALLLSKQNKVLLSYRGEAFKRIKPKNREAINSAINSGEMDMHFNSNLVSITEGKVLIKENGSEDYHPANRVYIFAGGELPTSFLQKTGIKVTRKFGDAILKH